MRPSVRSRSSSRRCSIQGSSKARGPRSAPGVGAFTLVRKSAFDETPGMEGLRLEIADDVALGSMLKASGARCGIANGRGSVAIAPYRDMRELFHSVEKGSYAILGRCSWRGSSQWSPPSPGSSCRRSPPSRPGSSPARLARDLRRGDVRRRDSHRARGRALQRELSGRRAPVASWAPSSSRSPWCGPAGSAGAGAASSGATASIRERRCASG